MPCRKRASSSTDPARATAENAAQPCNVTFQSRLHVEVGEFRRPAAVEQPGREIAALLERKAYDDLVGRQQAPGFGRRGGLDVEQLRVFRIGGLEPLLQAGIPRCAPGRTTAACSFGRFA